jgi:hypothetical protein
MVQFLHLGGFWGWLRSAKSKAGVNKEVGMRYLIGIIIVVAIGYFLFFREETHSVHVSSGVISYGRDTITSVDAAGYITLDGTTVKQKVDVKGRIDAKDARIGLLHVTGNASLTGCIVDGITDIQGFLNAVNTKFKDKIVISSNSLSLQACQVPSIEVRKTGWAFGSQVIELTKNSKVGGIIFESGNGKVIVSGGSTISGPVIGAEIEKRT